jgi:hypothetical protein
VNRHSCLERRRAPGLLVTAMLLFLSPVPALPAATAPDDAQFRAQYVRQYDLIKSLAPDMVVEEMRLRVELVASRGSQVGAASNDRRVRGFESALLKSLQNALCPGGKPLAAPPARPSPMVIDSVTVAANAQQLRTLGGDLAELTALAQRLVDSQPPARWCALKSLDEIR